MIRGLYSAATGMLAQQAVQDALASNLANINTTGFKQDVPTFRALYDMALNRYGGIDGGGAYVGNLGLGSAFDRAVTDFSPGSLTATQNPLDLALVGDGFFTVQTPAGERYTRAGAFHIEPVKTPPGAKPISYLVDDEGRRVLGTKGPIDTGGAQNVAVDDNGNVLVNGSAVDRLKIVTAMPSQMRKEGGNVFAILGTPVAASPKVRSGFLEQSNVSAVGSMVRMIAVQRAYEAAQRAVTSQDDELNKVINEAARL
ncbi:MAG: flagellar hook-basal body protein [Chthonomonadales bacterium]